MRTCSSENGNHTYTVNLHNVPGGIVGVGIANVGVAVFVSVSVSVSVYFRDQVIEQ